MQMVSTRPKCQRHQTQNKILIRRSGQMQTKESNPVPVYLPTNGEDSVSKKKKKKIRLKKHCNPPPEIEYAKSIYIECPMTVEGVSSDLIDLLEMKPLFLLTRIFLLM